MPQRLSALLTASFMAASAATAQAGGAHDFVLHLPRSPEDVCLAIVNAHSADHPPPQSLPSEPIEIVTADGRTVVVDAEIADTKAEQELGLMYRAELPAGHGMLFVDVKGAKDGRIGIWMKDTYIPLDILFLDAQGKIVGMHANAAACDTDVIWSGAPASGVLELPAGSIEALGLSVGDAVKYDDARAHKAAPVSPGPAIPPPRPQ
jgi:uncharacterized membrane protein (UPF0127 family)